MKQQCLIEKKKVTGKAQLSGTLTLRSNEFLEQDAMAGASEEGKEGKGRLKG